MNVEKRIDKITNWIGKYARKHNIQTLVIGVSGGIDSAVVSTLCAKTGLPVLAVSMPIKQSKWTHDLSVAHCKWLTDNFDNVKTMEIDLTKIFSQFESKLSLNKYDSELAFANSRSRLRMMTLYQIAQSANGIVVGTGNKVEDFGVGFFTKYGDGGVDISPIGDCYKSEVWDMGEHLNVNPDILSAPPTDGLWEDGRTDEDQLGMSYEQLELAMQMDLGELKPMTKKEKAALKQYRKIRARNLHKMKPIPVCTF